MTMDDENFKAGLFSEAGNVKNNELLILCEQLLEKWSVTWKRK